MKQPLDIRNLKTGDAFISFEEFVALPDCSFFQTDRVWSPRMSGPEWLKRYQIAKESWEKYGTNPPIDVKVAVLVNGHGTSFPSLTESQRFEMNWLPKQTLQKYKGNGISDEMYFSLKRDNGAISLVDKALWWRSIYVLKDSATKG